MITPINWRKIIKHFADVYDATAAPIEQPEDAIERISAMTHCRTADEVREMYRWWSDPARTPRLPPLFIV